MAQLLYSVIQRVFNFDRSVPCGAIGKRRRRLSTVSKHSHSQLLSLVFIALSGCLFGQPWSGILSSTRATDWTAVGIPGGIPSRTTICSTLNASTYGRGLSDATSAIQAALNGCPPGQTVSLSAGTFRINTSLKIPSNVTLRGAGASQTILNIQGSGGGAAILLGSNASPDTGTSKIISSGATQGSTTISVSSATGITVGSYVMVTELNDDTIPVTQNGVEGACTWCDGGLGWKGTRVAGQIVEVTSVAGTSIKFQPPLYISYANSPLATPFTAAAKYAGVENLQIYANNTGYDTNFEIGSCAYCWIKGVEGNFTDGDHVDVDWSYRGEIRDSYFTDAFLHTPGTHDSSVDFRNKSTGMLLENNILRRLHVAIMIEWGAAGNVIAYNYDSGDFDAGSTYFLTGGLDLHGAHPWFNLIEGNILVKMTHDPVWGSSSHNTHFRNWLIGTSSICNPLSGRGTLGTCCWAVQALYGTEIGQATRNLNSVGNVTGSATMAALTHYNDGVTPLHQVPSVVAPTTRSYDNVAYGYTWGYGGSADDGSGAGDTSAPYTTALIHGDYSAIANSTSWATSLTHLLPASFYRSSKPTWWGSTPWPSIGPDVLGGVGPGGHAYKIPAQNCYESSSTNSNGQIIFDASSCYYGQSTQPIIPPKGLTTVVH